MTDFNVADFVRRDIKVLVTKSHYTVCSHIIAVAYGIMVNTVDSIRQGNNSTMIILVNVNKHLKTDRCMSSIS